MGIRYHSIERMALEDDPFSSARTFVRGLDDFAIYPNPKSCQRKKVTIQLAIHDKSSDVIVVSMPGYSNELDGKRNRQLNLGNFIHEHIGAVVRCDNFPVNNTRYELLLLDNIREVIKYALDNAEEICGKQNPDIYLRGHSAGGSAAAGIAYEFPQIKKVLLISPGGDIGSEAIRKNLSEYQNELYVTGPIYDRYIGQNSARFFYNVAMRAKRREIHLLEDADHCFTGPLLSKVFSKAILWAFADDKTYPNPSGGIELDDIENLDIILKDSKKRKRWYLFWK